MEDSLSKKAEEFLKLFKKGEEFTKTLLKENEALRFRVAELEESLRKSESHERLRHLEEKIRLLEEELNSLREKYKKVEEENRDFAQRYVEVEEENNNLANLYVASYQLHSTLDYDEVLKTVVEIIINLLGAEVFAVMLLDEKQQKLVPEATEGINKDSIPHVPLGEGIIGEVALKGEAYFSDSPVHNKEFDPLKPLVCIPLKIKDSVIGVISIYSFLIQKKKFTHIDYELFNLLAGHAATAIFSAKLYTRSERKLTTIQGFLELLKQGKG